MKTTLIVIQNDADHAQAKALVEKLMDSKDPADRARHGGSGVSGRNV